MCAADKKYTLTLSTNVYDFGCELGNLAPGLGQQLISVSQCMLLLLVRRLESRHLFGGGTASARQLFLQLRRLQSTWI